MSKSVEVFRKAIDFEHHVENAFSELLEKPWRRTERIAWHPAIDIYESADSYCIVADLPGVDPAHIDIQMHHHKIMLCGRRSVKPVSRTCRYRVIERAVGRFCRLVPLEHDVDISQKQVQYQNGIFECILPKHRHTTEHCK